MNERYEEAFYCFAKAFRKQKYGNKIQYFKDGYNNTDSIKDKPLMLVIHESMHFSRVLVHYHETANVFKYRDITEIRNATLGDVREIHEQLAEFSSILISSLNAKQERVENIPLYLFFSPNAIEDASWSCGISYEDMAGYFKPSFRAITRVKYFDCKYSKDNGWEIARISPVFPAGEPFN